MLAGANAQDIEFDEYFNLEQYEDSDIDPEGAFPCLPIVVPLYSKLNTSLILGNISRADILNLITSTPGITLGAITKELKLKTGTAAHHLRILEREGYIKAKKTGKFKRYYLVGTKASGFNELQDQILQKVEEQPGLSQSELAQELGTSRQLVNYHMQQLISSNVILIEKLGNKSVCFHQ
jgi:predicted transcriptional regulator